MRWNEIRDVGRSNIAGRVAEKGLPESYDQLLKSTDLLACKTERLGQDDQCHPAQTARSLAGASGSGKCPWHRAVSHAIWSRKRRTTNRDT